MAPQPTVFLLHIKIIEGTTPVDGAIPIPDFLLQMAAAAVGTKVEKPAAPLERIFLLSQALEAIRVKVASTAFLSLPIPSAGGNGVWVESPDTVVSRATDQTNGTDPVYPYKYEFDEGVTEVEFCASLGYA